MAAKEKKEVTCVIARPNLQEAEFVLRGTSYYCQNKFSHKAKEEMKAKQEAGSQAKKGRKRDPKDFELCYKQAQHTFVDKGGKEHWGIPAPAFRNACISACRLVNFKMTIAKLSVFVLADGYDKEDNTPLVRITKGVPHRQDDVVRNETGVADIRPRPIWEPGWEAKLRIRYDADQFSLQDVSNLLMRVGMQVGIGEGRPDSKNSAGLGWGTFEILGKADEDEKQEPKKAVA